MRPFDLRTAAAILACCTAVNGFAQDRQESSIEALIAEVRRLRVALEQSVVTLPRIQILLQRVQTQQSRVDRLSTRLQDIRFNETGGGANALAAHIKDVEARLSQEQDPGRRRELQHEIESVKEQMKVASAQGQQQQVQESEIAGELRTEQAKLNELERQLSGLESLLPSPQPSTPKPAR